MSVVVLENTHEIKCIFKQAVLIRRNRMEKEHHDFWILIMEGLPSVILKSIAEVINRLENDEDNLF